MLSRRLDGRGQHDFFLVDRESFRFERIRDFLVGHAAEKFSVFAQLDPDEHRPPVHPVAQFAVQPLLFGDVEGERVLLHFVVVYFLRRRGFRQAFFDQKVLGESVFRLDEVALFSRSFYIF